jgi:tetratricopeptide (TPR) repeat protein
MTGNFASAAKSVCVNCSGLALSGLLLVSAVAAVGQQAPAGQKIIHDPAEYNAYTAAVNTQDANKRAEALEAFVQQYPQSVVLTDALEQELAAWQTAGDSSQMKRVAKRLLAADPGNVRVLGVVVALDRVSAARGDLASLNEMCVEATGGMREVSTWRKPAGMSDADFAALSKLMNDIFIGAEGFCAVQEKNYPEARDWFARALAIDPSNVQDVYELAIADLESTPVDANGFWYCGRAIHLAQSAAIPQDASAMENYCKTKYKQFHGADDGWDGVMTVSAAQDTPPADFAKQIKPAPAAQKKIHSRLQHHAAQTLFAARPRCTSSAVCAPRPCARATSPTALLYLNHALRLPAGTPLLHRRCSSHCVRPPRPTDLRHVSLDRFSRRQGSKHRRLGHAFVAGGEVDGDPRDRRCLRRGSGRHHRSPYAELASQ